MDDYGKKSFEWQYLSQEGRYRTLTSRYGYNKYVKAIFSFKNNARFLFFQLIYNYNSISSALAEILPLKIILPIVAHTNFTNVPTLQQPFYVCDIILDKAHCLTVWNVTGTGKKCIKFAFY